MKPDEIAARLKDRFAKQITGENLQSFTPWVSVAPKAILEVAQFCRDDDALSLDYLRNLSAVDWLVADEKKAKKLNIDPHLEVVYHLFSFTHKHNFTLKVMLPRWQADKEGELPEMPSVAHVWPVADWHEREVYDLFGINFTGHPDLRRILCTDDWVGYPLRKDYEFPLEYHGIRGR